MRLSKYLSTAGVASRRRSEEIIVSGRVTVNGDVVTLPQHRVEKGDQVAVDGGPVRPTEKKQYLLLNKPAGFLCTVTDTHDRPTVLNLIGPSSARLYPVGRLDLDTTGLLLLTDDGELAYRLTHPRFGIEKKYSVQVKGSPSPAVLRQLARGVRLEEGITAPARVRLLRRGKTSAHLEITLIEGRKRQVKRICAHVGHPVLHLRRKGFAFLTAAGLEIGNYRHLRANEVRRLYRLVGLSSRTL